MYNPDMHPNKQRLPLDEIAGLYRQGLPARDIAPRFGTSPQTILRRLREAGEPLRPIGSWASGRQPMPLDEDRLRELSGQGLSTKEIGQEMGAPAEVVRERMVKLGIPRLPGKARPDRNYFWKGGRIVDRDGYILVLCPEHPYRTKGGYVREHRLVMERELGRYLLPTEVVDHIDGQRAHNDPSNLRVFASNKEHLAATLQGRVPAWTEDGLRRIREGVQRRHSKEDASRTASRTDEPSSP